MIRIYTFFILFLCALSSCEDRIEKGLISNSGKLISPKNKFSLYRYSVESSMAFGSGFTAVKILDSKTQCDYTDHDFFTFDKGYPFCCKWKNEDTLQVKCLFRGRELEEHQPVRTEIKKWKKWIFEVSYYSQYSAGYGGKFQVNNYRVTQDSIFFNLKTNTLAFANNEIQFSLGSNRISIEEFRLDTIDSKVGISLSNYHFTLDSNLNMHYFFTQQPFLETIPK